jgi:hypothetical protein
MWKLQRAWHATLQAALWSGAAPAESIIAARRVVPSGSVLIDWGTASFCILSASPVIA